MIPGTLWRPYQLAPFPKAEERTREGLRRWVWAGSDCVNTPYLVGHIGIPQPTSERVKEGAASVKGRSETRYITTYPAFAADPQEVLACTLVTWANGGAPGHSVYATIPVRTREQVATRSIHVDRSSGLGAIPLRAVEVVSTERLRLLIRLPGKAFDGALVSVPEGTLGPIEGDTPDFLRQILSSSSVDGGTITRCGSGHLLIGNGERVQLTSEGVTVILIVENGELHIFTPAFAKRWLR